MRRWPYLTRRTMPISIRTMKHKHCPLRATFRKVIVIFISAFTVRLLLAFSLHHFYGISRWSFGQWHRPVNCITIYLCPLYELRWISLRRIPWVRRRSFVNETFILFIYWMSVVRSFLGRVLNRAVNDIGNIDDNLPRIYQAVVNVSSLSFATFSKL